MNPSIHLEVFIHKVDGLTNDFQQGPSHAHRHCVSFLTVDIKREIQQRIGDELADVGLLDVPIEYHMTSIFDHSIFEAFSKIIQKLIPKLHTLQDLLNNLVDVPSHPFSRRIPPRLPLRCGLCRSFGRILMVDDGYYEGLSVRCY